MATRKKKCEHFLHVHSTFPNPSPSHSGSPAVTEALIHDVLLVQQFYYRREKQTSKTSRGYRRASYAQYLKHVGIVVRVTKLFFRHWRPGLLSSRSAFRSRDSEFPLRRRCNDATTQNREGVLLR